MVPILGLISLAIQALAWVVIAGVVLSMIGQAFHGDWVYSPFFWSIIQFGRKLCEPVRRLMERFGVPMRPFDWSPMIVVFALNFLSRVVDQMLTGRH